MHPHLIYSASSSMKNRANWSEWVYCGVGNDTKGDLIDKTINEYFHDSMLYFVSTRNGSSEVNKQDIVAKIKKELEQNALFLWDANFKKVIEFNEIGVMRNGLVPTHI